MEWRRVVTTFAGGGVAEDGPAPVVVPAGDGQIAHCVYWETDERLLASVEHDLVRAQGSQRQAARAPGSTTFMSARFGPGARAELHRTDTIDYVVVVSGAIVLGFDDGSEVALQAGDAVVQRGGLHVWENRGATDCVLAVTMIAVPDGARPESN